MFDIGMSELLLVGIVALIVVGPKDLPALFHTLGRFTAKMRSLGREFTSAMNDAARESGMDDVAKGLKGVANPKKFGLDKLTEAADRFDKWEPGQPKTSTRPAKAPDDPERAADVEKIRAATEKAGQARLDQEAAARAEADKGGAKIGPGTAADKPAKPAAKARTATAKPAAKARAATAKPSGTSKKAPAKAAATKTVAAKPAAAKPAATKTAKAKAAKAKASAAKASAPEPAKAKAAKSAAPKADNA